METSLEQSPGSRGGDIRVGIDCRSLAGGPCGIRTYVSSLLSRMPFLDGVYSARPKNNFLWNNLRIPLAHLWRRWDLYHAPSYTGPLIKLGPVVLSVHDISYLVREEWYPYRLDPYRRRYYIASLKRADRILTPTEFTAGEIARFFPELAARTRPVHLGVDPFWCHNAAAASDARQLFKLPGEFILQVGDIHPRRNVQLSVEVANRLDIALVIVGRLLSGPSPEGERVYLLSNVSREQLQGLYSGATVLLYPSLYEGFGLPLLEAMACDLPVVASNRSCIPEVCGAAAVLVEPDADSLVEGVLKALGEREALVDHGRARVAPFNWERTARETKEVYLEVV